MSCLLRFSLSPFKSSAPLIEQPFLSFSFFLHALFIISRASAKIFLLYFKLFYQHFSQAISLRELTFFPAVTFPYPQPQLDPLSPFEVLNFAAHLSSSYEHIYYTLGPFDNGHRGYANLLQINVRGWATSHGLYACK